MKKIAHELEEIKEKLLLLEEGVEDTSLFGINERVKRLEQLLSTNKTDLDICWQKLVYLERELFRIKVVDKRDKEE